MKLLIRINTDQMNPKSWIIDVRKNSCDGRSKFAIGNGFKLVGFLSKKYQFNVGFLVFMRRTCHFLRKVNGVIRKIGKVL